MKFTKDLIPVLNRDDIYKRVVEIARNISADYAESELVLIGVLRGAFIFLADLVRQLTIPVRIDFIAISTYGSDTCSSCQIKVKKEVELDLRDKDVLIVEDIVDTGLTIEFLYEYLKKRGPKRVKACTLLDKTSRRTVDVKIDYVGHVVGEGFFVGYGLDYDQNYRQLPDIYHLKI